MKKLLVLLLILCFPIVAYGQTNDEAKDRQLSNIYERLDQIEKDMDSFKLSKELFGYTLTMYTAIVVVILLASISIVGILSYRMVRKMVEDKFREAEQKQRDEFMKFTEEQEGKLKDLKRDIGATLTKSVEDMNRRISHLGKSI